MVLDQNKRRNLTLPGAKRHSCRHCLGDMGTFLYHFAFKNPLKRHLVVMGAGHNGRMNKFTTLYDTVEAWWHGRHVLRCIYLFLIFFFSASTTLFCLNKGGLLPEPLASLLPDNPYYAIQLAFSLILLLEVMELLLAVAKSVALAMAKQLEVMSLILLRDAFTDISLLHHPIDIQHDYIVLLQIAVVAVSGLLLFLFRVLFSKFQHIQTYGMATQRYICAKKCISLALTTATILICLYDFYGIFVLKHRSIFFEALYTMLVFANILLLLLGQYFMSSFHMIFRNSGYAVSTLLMYISLNVPHHVGAAFCVAAGCFMLALTWSTARFRSPEEGDIRACGT